METNISKQKINKVCNLNSTLSTRNMKECPIKVRFFC